MFLNNLKISWRNLQKNWVYSLINILGLTIGFAASALILLWVNDEKSFENTHQNKDRIFQAWNRVTDKGETNCWNVTPQIMGVMLQKDYPEIEKMVRTDWPDKALMQFKETKLKGTVQVVDSTFLDVFTFPLLKGDPKTCLNGVNNIVVTKDFAQKLFGNKDPIGQIVKLHNESDFMVTGVLDNLPTNTQFKFDCLVPWRFKVAHNIESLFWGNNSTTTYVLLEKNVDYVAFNEKVKHLRKNYDQETANWETFIYPFAKLRLYGSFKNGIEEGGKIETVRNFTVIALLILLIACINFINLSTARGDKRAKEVGIRKSAGANRLSLIKQFYTESFLTAVLAAILAMFITTLSLPKFNELIDSKIIINWLDVHWLVYTFTFIVAAGLVAGSYPALYLSSFNPLKVLKGSYINIPSTLTPRKVLVVFQFVFCVLLISCTIIITKQLDQAQKRKVGYNKENLIFHAMEGDIDKNFNVIKEALIKNDIAVSVVKTFSPITETWSNTGGMQWRGKADDDHRNVDRFGGDDKIATTLGLEIIDGRDFDLKAYPTDSSGIIINETMKKMMGFKNPIGEKITDGGWEFYVIGVVKDFIMQSPFQEISAVTIAGPKMSMFNAVHVKYNSTKPIKENLAKAEVIFRKYNPNYPFEYSFVEEEYNQKFTNVARLSAMAKWFTFLTIFITCLGLFGLVTSLAQNKIKEIGIRKVLGADIQQIIFLMSKDFIAPILIAIVIASPLAYWIMEQWLQKYPFRININLLVFVWAGILTFTIAFFTVSYQAIKAALMNPVKSLKTE
ncbi:MAG: ABC transporter permease [Saprospiraceae bacterium]|jgi:putative ABC transport system permease protein|nr:ABC transporter permease [Saprospiraceae bacterium]